MEETVAMVEETVARVEETVARLEESTSWPIIWPRVKTARLAKWTAGPASGSG